MEWVIAALVGLFALSRGSRSSVAQGGPIGTGGGSSVGGANVNYGGEAPAPPDWRQYVADLYQLQTQYGPSIWAAWGLDRLRTVAEAAAAYVTAAGYPVSAEQLWGVIYRESHWAPLGIKGIYGPPPWHGLPADISGTDWGIGQMLESRFREGLKPWAAVHLPGLVWWDHAATLWPRLGLWSVAAELGRLAAKLGRAPTDFEVGRWWACPSLATCDGAVKKAASIAQLGYLVRERGPIPVASSNVPGPAAQPTDGQPPTQLDWYQ